MLSTGVLLLFGLPKVHDRAPFLVPFGAKAAHDEGAGGVEALEARFPKAAGLAESNKYIIHKI